MGCVSSRLFQFDNVDIWLNYSNIELYGKKFEYFLTEWEHECVSQMYAFAFGQIIVIPNNCWKTDSLKKAGETYVYVYVVLNRQIYWRTG